MQTPFGAFHQGPSYIYPYVGHTLAIRLIRSSYVKQSSRTACWRSAYALLSLLKHYMYAMHTLWVHRARAVRKEDVRIACALRIQRKHNERGASAVRVQSLLIVRRRTSRSFVHAQNFGTRSA